LIGHRVAHGGDLFTESVIISEEVIDNIRQVSSLAPLHNYASLSGIASAQRLFPGVSRWRSLIPASTRRWRRKPFSMVCRGVLPELGVRRYGFHGTSHRYVSQRAQACWAAGAGERSGDRPPGQRRLDLRGAQRPSVDTSMGMTPLEGLMMGTRSGDVDFGAMAWIAAKPTRPSATLSGW
jgi:propionate kinase